MVRGDTKPWLRDGAGKPIKRQTIPNATPYSQYS